MVPPAIIGGVDQRGGAYVDIFSVNNYFEMWTSAFEMSKYFFSVNFIL